MKFPSKRTVEKIYEHHQNATIRLTYQTSTLALMYHWLFIKKLASTCDNIAFRQKKVCINEIDVARCAPNVLLTFNEYERVRRNRLAREKAKKQQERDTTQSQTSSGSSSRVLVDSAGPQSKIRRKK